uniref:Immunoglobulin subtype domain-containing protein n=1 Tax=Mola mola TaxID=94237 RepID=A0A3Q3WGP1_MOLML
MVSFAATQALWILVIHTHILKNVCVSVGGNVSVPCPWSHAEQLKFNLLQDGRIIYMHRTCRNGGNAPDCEPNNTRMGVEVQENTENKSVSFLLTGVNASSHGIYRCEGIVMFPPPLVSVPSDLGILVLIRGHQCNNVCRNERTDGDKNCGFHWIWIIVLLSSYSIVATSGTVFFWVMLFTKRPVSWLFGSNISHVCRRKHHYTNWCLMQYFYS